MELKRSSDLRRVTEDDREAIDTTHVVRKEARNGTSSVKINS